MTPMVSATIDTAALKHNLQRIRDFAPRSRVMAVIKANAYGHGLVAVARALDQADAFAVARVDEGLTLRMAGIQKRTVLLEGVFDRGQLDSASAAGFELVVHTPRTDRAAAAGRRGRAVSDLAQARHRHEPSRLQGRGVSAPRSRRCAPLPRVQSPVNLFTHLASADDPDSPATVEQLARFAAATCGARQASAASPTPPACWAFRRRRPTGCAPACCSMAYRRSTDRSAPTMDCCRS